MSNINLIDEILHDLYEIDPELAQKEEELKKIIDKLLSSKPEISMNEAFKKQLKERILTGIQKKQQGINKQVPLSRFTNWIFRNKLKVGFAAAALFTMVMAFGFLLPVILPGSKSGSLSFSADTDKTGKNINDESGSVPAVADDRIVRDDKIVSNKDKAKQSENKNEKKSGDKTVALSKGSTSTVTGEEVPGDYIEVVPEPEVIRSEYYVESSGYIERKDYEQITGSDNTTGGGDTTGGESVTQEKKSVAVAEKEEDWNTEEYDRIYENNFLVAKDNPLSTFSIDVDTASYANVRRFIQSSQLPYPDAVRIEELINYFTYDYPEPKGEHPFAFFTEISDCPWAKDHRLIHIGIQGKKIPAEQLPPSNLVFLLDVSGSMSDENKLPLLKEAFALLVNELRSSDRVAIVVYAGAAGIVLPSTPGSDKLTILDALNRLESGGSTAGGEGIRLAYATAKQNLNRKGNNRVILATDGDFNIGPSSDAELVRMIEEKRNEGIFLTILGFGMGNYKDSKMEKLADKGNGNYAYIDTLKEAKKVLVSELGGTLVAIAKDVKIQVEFNPAYVDSYRLIGYENRMLAKEDFIDDTKDAGELGAGHTVTALYEIIPASGKKDSTQSLKYQETKVKDDAYASAELMTLKFRYKKPDADTSIPIEVPVIDGHKPLSAASENFRFSSAVAEWGLLLKNSEFRGSASFSQVLDLARNALGNDKEGYRHEFIALVEASMKLMSK